MTKLNILGRKQLAEYLLWTVRGGTWIMDQLEFPVSFCGFSCADIQDLIERYNLEISEITLNQKFQENLNINSALTFLDKSNFSFLLEAIYKKFPSKEFYNLITELHEYISYETFNYNGWYSIPKKTEKYIAEKIISTRKRTLKLDAFISYSQIDGKKIANKLNTKLSSLGFKIFQDNESIHLGNHIKERIDEATHESLCGIILLTKSYLESKWCKYEMNLFNTKNLAADYDVVIPIIIEGDYKDYEAKLPRELKSLLIKSYDTDVTDMEIIRKILSALRKS